MHKTIYIKESEKDVLGVLTEQGIDVSSFQNYLTPLFKRVYNNYVGYYTFKQGSLVYKLIVLPKTIKENKEAEKEFVNYLLHYYRLNNTYAFDTEKKIPNSLLQLLFESNNDDYSSHDRLNAFEFEKQKAILLSIEAFFKRHKNSKRIGVNHTSQSIKHKFDLKSNIRELDKTKIHQIQNQEIHYSLMATITFYALKIFSLTLYAEHQKELLSEVKRVKNFLLKKYAIEKGYKLSLHELQGLRVLKVFSKTLESKQLLVGIKSLFGFEQMYRDSQVQVGYRDDLKTTSLFIDPIKFYEWYVYDILKKYSDEESRTLLFDKIESKTTTPYRLIAREAQAKKKSQPDYIIIDEKKKVKIIIDAKWKNIERVGEVSSNDYLKLKFDSFLISNDGYVTASYLVYPSLAMGNSSLSIYNDDKSIFDFNTIEINMNFDKDKNSLDFHYDSQSFTDKIIETEEQELIKSHVEKLSSEIDSHRAEIITKLMAEDTTAQKDELFYNLDNHLIDTANKLNEALGERPLLPEIKKILDNYDEVLEEESIKFLKSSSTIYSYYKEKNYEHFDYSMPGSGFWKLIELELNTSFIWFIRIQSHVCSYESSWIKVCNKNKRIEQHLDNGKKVLLTKSEKRNKQRLESVMFGGIKLLLEDNSTLSELDGFFEEYRGEETFIKNSLVTVVQQVSILRNEHAHIKAMSLEKFEQLWEIVFNMNEDKMTLLDKLLNFKKNMKQYIERSQ